MDQTALLVSQLIGLVVRRAGSLAFGLAVVPPAGHPCVGPMKRAVFRSTRMSDSA